MNISEIFISNSQHIDVYICVLRWDFVNKALYQHSLKSAVIEMGLRESARLVLTPQEILGKAGDLAAKQAEAALKVLINSLFGFYGTSGVGFNDMEAAALVTAYGRRILRFMIDVIEKAGGIQVESDTDGVFFSHSEPLLIFEKLQNALPTGIKIELEILAKAMFVPSRGAKNHILFGTPYQTKFIILHKINYTLMCGNSNNVLNLNILHRDVSMNKLVMFYQKRENDLKRQLGEASSLTQSIEKIQDEINRLRDTDGEYINNLTPSEAGIALKRLEEVNQFISLFKEVELRNSTSATNTQFSFSELSVAKNTSQTMIATVVISGSIVGSFVGGLLSKKELRIPPLNFPEKLDKFCQSYPEPNNINNKFPDFFQKIKSVCDYEKSFTNSPIVLAPNFPEKLDKFCQPYVNIEDNFPELAQKIDSVCIPKVQFTNDVIISVKPVFIGFLFGGMVAGILVVIFLSLRKKKQRLEKPITQITETHKNNLKRITDGILSYVQTALKAIDREIAKENNLNNS